MDPKTFHRKLAAILSADVAGYSRLMQDDEAATVATLEAYKQVISDLIKQHRGRVVDSPGDNLLAEFASVVDAVQCAVAVQKELQARNAELPENRKMLFRIGVNLGGCDRRRRPDLRRRGEHRRAAGGLAEPGGICVSKTAFDQIETKLPFGYEFLGEQTVKNIAKPVGAYRVLLEPRVTKGKGSGFRVQGARRRKMIAGLAVVLLLVAVGGLMAGFPATCCSPAWAPRGESRPQTDGPAFARPAVDRRVAIREPERGPGTTAPVRWYHRQYYQCAFNNPAPIGHSP